MEQTQGTDSRKEIKLNLDDFDLDNFEIKPINKGLGFHKSEERVRYNSRAARTTRIEQNRPKPKAMNTFSQPQTSLRENHVEPLPRLLREESGEKLVDESAPLEVSYCEAEPLKRVAAYLIDLLILVTLFSLLAGTFLVIAGQSLQFESVMSLVGNADLLISGGLFFALLYLLYFSILDMHSSFGKDVCGLKVTSRLKANLSITDSFVRTLFSLVSFLALGLPMLLDFHSRLSDTIVIAKD